MNKNKEMETVGSLKEELEEIKKLALSHDKDDAYNTLTASVCSGFLTILCC